MDTRHNPDGVLNSELPEGVTSAKLSELFQDPKNAKNATPAGFFGNDDDTGIENDPTSFSLPPAAAAAPAEKFSLGKWFANLTAKIKKSKKDDTAAVSVSPSIIAASGEEDKFVAEASGSSAAAAPAVNDDAEGRGRIIEDLSTNAPATPKKSVKPPRKTLSQWWNETKPKIAHFFERADNMLNPFNNVIYRSGPAKHSASMHSTFGEKVGQTYDVFVGQQGAGLVYRKLGVFKYPSAIEEFNVNARWGLLDFVTLGRLWHFLADASKKVYNLNHYGINNKWLRALALLSTALVGLVGRMVFGSIHITVNSIVKPVVGSLLVIPSLLFDVVAHAVTTLTQQLMAGRMIAKHNKTAEEAAKLQGAWLARTFGYVKENAIVNKSNSELDQSQEFGFKSKARKPAPRAYVNVALAKAEKTGLDLNFTQPNGKVGTKRVTFFYASNATCDTAVIVNKHARVDSLKQSVMPGLEGLQAQPESLRKKSR
jgi:hypothetical protein